ncbi:MAG: hypothetical protein AAFU53_00790 [Cyanobacteria bacterium J06632_3]
MTILKERESTVTTIASPATEPSIPPKQASRLRQFGRAIARHPQITQVFLLLVITSGTSIFLLYLLFRGAWSTHQDNVAVLSTIFKMELSRKDTLALGDSPQQVITRSYKTLDAYVEPDGWSWVNRFSSTITYGKQEQRLIASCSSYSPIYIICSLSEIP